MSGTVIIKHKMPLISSLTSLRFFAALMVFCSHLFFWINNNNHFANQLGSIFYEGYIGVTFFFILSGFILTYNYNDDVNAKKINTKGFLILRLSRIYPTHLLTFLISIPLLGYISKTLLIPGIFNAALLQSFAPKLYCCFNDVSWSISDELFFYSICCVLLLLPFKKLTTLLMVELGVIITLLLIAGHSRIPFDLQHWFFYNFPLTRTIDFITGIVLAKIFIKNSETIRNKYSTKCFTLLETMSICLLMLFAYLALRHKIPQILRYDIYYVIPMSLIVIIFAFEKGLISRLLTSKSLVFLGEISFSMYMFHRMIILYVDEHFIAPHHYSFGLLSASALTIALLSFTIVISATNYSLYEMPLNRFFRKKFKSKIMTRTHPVTHKKTKPIQTNSITA